MPKYPKVKKPVIKHVKNRETKQRDIIKYDDTMYNKFLKEVNRLISNKNKYTFDEFSNDFNKFTNIYALDNAVDFDELKDSYIDIVLNLFKELEIKKIVDTNDINYNFNKFTDEINDFFKKNNITLGYFNKNARDLNKLYDDINEAVGKLYIYKVNVENKEKNKSVIKGLFTKFVQRFVALETD